MIVVESVLVPHGDPRAPRTRLCRLEIANDGTGTMARRNYDVRLLSRGAKPRLVRTARIEGFPSQSLPAWRLIAAAFEALEKAK